MELQTSLVNSHIEDLHRTAREVHASAPTVAKPPSGSSLDGLRRSLGWRLVGIGLALVSQGQSPSRPTLIRVV